MFYHPLCTWALMCSLSLPLFYSIRTLHTSGLPGHMSGTFVIAEIWVCVALTSSGVRLGMLENIHAQDSPPNTKHGPVLSICSSMARALQSRVPFHLA